MNTTQATVEPHSAGWRFKLGIIILCVMLGSWLLVPLAAGIVMFFVPVVSAFLEPYIDTLWPGLRPNLWQVQALGDLMLIASVFVLGGNVWEKVRALFTRKARIANAEAV
jgi:hypothetical protein